VAEYHRTTAEDPSATPCGATISGHVCASLLIAFFAADIQLAHQMEHSKIETTKNIDSHLFAQRRTAILDAMTQAVSRLYVYESADNGKDQVV
jgi:hypothetical protein